MSESPKLTAVPAILAIINCGSDAMEFALQPDTFPVFWEWLKCQPGIASTVTADQTHQDMNTILIAARQMQRSGGYPY